jgi:hypothetical protein
MKGRMQVTALKETKNFFLKNCKISGLYGGGYEKCRLMGCDAVWLF